MQEHVHRYKIFFTGSYVNFNFHNQLTQPHILSLHISFIFEQTDRTRTNEETDGKEWKQTNEQVYTMLDFVEYHLSPSIILLHMTLDRSYIQIIGMKISQLWSTYAKHSLICMKRSKTQSSYISSIWQMCLVWHIMKST